MKTTIINPWKYAMALAISCILVLAACATANAQDVDQSFIKIKGKVLNAPSTTITIYEQGVVAISFTINKKFNFKLNTTHEYKVIFASESGQKVMYVNPSNREGAYVIYGMNIDFDINVCDGYLHYIPDVDEYVFLAFSP